MRWCNYKGRPSVLGIQKSLDDILEIQSRRVKASSNDVLFRDTDYFIAVELHNHYDIWDHILQGFNKRDEFLKHIKHGVSVYDYFQPFKWDFMGKFYDSPSPPRIFLENNKICSEYEEFISYIIL